MSRFAGFFLSFVILWGAAHSPALAEDKTLTVFAAASMKNALDDIDAAFTAKTGVKVNASYAASSQLAKQIYELKRRREQIRGEFVEINCATLRGDQAMSALFGHTKGAFTGATTSRPGLLKAADGGLLFLDEIGELGIDEQAMLLRAIEEKIGEIP